MAENIKVRWLVDCEQNKIAPKTLSTQILNEDGTRFKDVVENAIANVETETVTHASNSDIHVTAEEKEAWSNYATKEYVEALYKNLGSTTSLGFYCIEDVTIVTNGISKVYPANSNVEITFAENDIFEIITTSDNSILSLNAFPGALGTYYPWLEGVKQFSNILFDMNNEDMYSKWSQGNQGSYQVQFAQYTNCIFWSDNPYISDVAKRTNYTLCSTSQLPLCYSTIPDNTFKSFYLAFGVNSDPNWNNPLYKESFAKATWATQAFSYYGARIVGFPGHDSASFTITLPKDCRGLMFDARNIECAGTFDAVNTTNFGAKSGSWREAFGDCTSLRRLYIKNLKVNLNISWSPIDYDSISYIISAAANTTAITISVSPYTYNLLSQSDFDLAASKNITIALITTNYVEDKRLSTITDKMVDITASVDTLNILVGNTSVSEQITSAIEEFEDATIAYVDEKFAEIPEFDPKELQDAIGENTAAIDSKVDKVDGKGLSTHDYTTAEKDKLATIEDNANFYEHPVHDSHSLGLYKITVDDSGHVSGATLVGKEDIVTLGIPAQDTTYEEEIEGLNGRIDDVEDDIRIIINEMLDGLSEEFENYKELNNKAVSTNTSDIEANKVSIEGIIADYLKLSDKTQLQDDISQVSGRVTDNEDAIKILKGDGDGSIKKSIDNAFNEFSANVTNDDVINTYKELIDYAATHGPEFAGLVGEVDTVKIDVGEMEINFSDYKTEVSECFANTDLKIDGHITNVNNPHNVTKTQIGLENVDNTSDLEKPISNAVQEALEEKANFNHDHNELYYTKDEISESITVEDIDNICGSNNGDGFDFVRIATEDWVQANYQIKGNYLTEVPDEYLRNDELQSAINTALAQAKEGGEFDGEKGDKGDKGDQGDQGKPGTNGEDGYSPVRGTDYWTAADIAEIKSYVDNAILGGAW